VRVERLFADPCYAFLNGDTGSTARVLDPPLPVLLEAMEVRKIAHSDVVHEAFRRWGVTFTEEEGDASGAIPRQVYVQSIPEVVAEKVGLSVHLVTSCIHNISVINGERTSKSC
jgi:hypothetical protein